MAEPAMRGRHLAGRIAAFEFGMQTRSPVFLIVVAISALMVVGTLTVERLQVGPLRTGNRTSVEAVVTVHLVWSLFFLFTAAAFAADAALRDEPARFDAIVRSTPAPTGAVAAGRLGGALAAVLLSFLSVPAATFLAPFAPWAASQAAPGLTATACSVLILAVPNLVLAAAIFFALATVARSAMAAYLGAVALLVLYELGSGSAGSPSLALTLLDPFGFAAVRYATSGWNAAERATSLPPIAGVLAANRLLWLGVSIGAAGLATWWRPRTRRPVRPRRPGAQVPAPTWRSVPSERPFDRRTKIVQFAARTRLEFVGVLRSPFFPVLLVLGLASVAGAFAQLQPDATLGAAMLRVDDAFRLVPVVVALFWAGELVWRERDVGMDGIVGASPVPGAALLLPKALTLILIIGGSLCTAALAAAGSEAWRTGTPQVDAWLIGFALPRTWDAALLAILAVFLQAIAPGKLAGFGLMVLYLIGALASETMGFDGDLYRYGGASASLDLARAGSAHGLLVRSYWAVAALLLLLAAQKLTARGATERLGTGIGRAVRELGRREALLLSAALAALCLLGIALSSTDRMP